ncbi:MAG: hypothetical protein ACRBCI_10545 [Cellvibrionaceae bacterium]
MTKVHFRLLVVLSFLLPVIGGIYDYVWPNSLLDQASEYVLSIETETSDTEDLLTTIWLAVLVVISITSVIGLLLFKRWGRQLYIAAFLVAAPFPFFSGIVVYGAIGQISNDLSFLLSGMIISLMYFSPLSKEFKKRGHSKSIGIV